NPLAIAMEGVGYLSRKIKTEDENINKTLQYIKDSIKRADNIIINLLHVARITELDSELCDLNYIIQNSINEHTPLFEKHGIKIVQSLYQTLPETKLDIEKIKQILTNIFINAVAAMSEGGSISISTSHANSNILVDIKDNGAGIAEEILNKIYDPFFTTKSHTGGTGLGLWITKQMVELHGGIITIENNPDKGATVKLRFPAVS
ncbi:MAG: HAMP domain-containing sensor histidine kinase, partial [Candidatus Margulisiibacteriota bacterium]